jgi:hypothetical protein
LEKTTPKTKSQFIPSYSNTTNSSHNNMNVKLIVEVYVLCITENMNKKYNTIPCFVEKNPKTTMKIYGISKHNLWFSTPKSYTHPTPLTLPPLYFGFCL